MVLMRRSSIAVLLLRLIAAVSLTALATGVAMTPAVAVSGSAWAWGFNGSDRPVSGGELGDGTTTGTSSPVAVSMPAGVTFSAIAVGGNHSLALDSSGHAWAWGNNGVGELGDGTAGNIRTTPVAVSMPAGVTFSAIAAGEGHNLALDSSGHAWAWGFNGYGQLGVGTFGGQAVDQTTAPLYRAAPVAVSMPAGVTFSAIAAGENHSLALDSNGQAWGWGDNSYGQLGDGTTDFRTTPVAASMPAGVTFSAIAAGRAFCLALDSNGQAWGWGENTDGQLGDGASGNGQTTPVAVSMPIGVTFNAIAAGMAHSLALDSSGHAWAWGANGDYLQTFGQLGDGTSGNRRTTPVAVSMPAGVTFGAIAAGEAHSLALDSSGPGQGQVNRPLAAPALARAVPSKPQPRMPTPLPRR